MRRYLFMAIALCVAGLAFWAISIFRSSPDAPAPPPRAGAMQNFTPAEPPKPAPSARLIAADGTEKGWEAWRGKFVLVNFWATWCGPCVREMPSLQRLQAALGSDRFTVLALSQDLKGWDVIAPFLERLKLDALPVLHDPQGAAARGFGVAGLPATILLDPDGRELGRLTGPAEWDDADAQALIWHYLAMDLPQ
jgi:thiol-disulfide isomerase/thioredoxin